MSGDAEMSRPPISLAELLAIEDDAFVAGVKCRATGLPLWPQVRSVYLRAAISALVYGDAIGSASNAKVPARRAISTLARSAAHNFRQLGKRSGSGRICIVGSSVADRLHDERWLNRLTDDLAGVALDDTTVLLEHFEWQWRPDRHHPHWLAQTPWQAAHAFAGRTLVRRDHVEEARALVVHVGSRAERLVGWRPTPAQEDALVQMLARKAAAVPRQYRDYARLFDKLGTRLLMVSCGCYGPAGAMIAAARDAGIATAEYQHGAVSQGHDGYNFAAALLADPAFRRSLPEYFLSYGSWWASQINAPVTPVPIGNPERERHLGGQRFDASGMPRDRVLILSDGFAFERYRELGRAIAPAAAACGLQVHIRPHPLERTVVENTWQETSLQLDASPSLYEALRHTDLVVGEVSTGLFDAVGTGARVLAWDTSWTRFTYPELPFDRFNDIGELAAALTNRHPGTTPDDMRTSLWQEGWRDHYRAFLADLNVLDDETVQRSAGASV